MRARALAYRVCVSYLRPCDRKFALVISPGPLDFSSDAECILSCLVAFGDVPNEFPNVFGSGFVALDPRCGWSRLALASTSDADASSSPPPPILPISL